MDGRPPRQRRYAQHRHCTPVPTTHAVPRCQGVVYRRSASPNFGTRCYRRARRRLLITMGDVLTFSDDEDFLVGESDEEGASSAPLVHVPVRQCCCLLLRMHRPNMNATRMRARSRTGGERVNASIGVNGAIATCKRPPHHRRMSMNHGHHHRQFEQCAHGMPSVYGSLQEASAKGSQDRKTLGSVGALGSLGRECLDAAECVVSQQPPAGDAASHRASHASAWLTCTIRWASARLCGVRAGRLWVCRHERDGLGSCRGVTDWGSWSMRGAEALVQPSVEAAPTEPEAVAADPAEEDDLYGEMDIGTSVCTLGRDGSS
jgi:hypothetical protein